jgi:tripeptidyl-peptidase-1
MYRVRYGNHLSKEEVDAFVAPHPDTTSIVDQWLQHHGIDGASTSGSFVTIPAITVAQVERLLGAKYAVYHHSGTTTYVVRTTSYSLPTELHSHVDVVSPTTYFSTMKTMRATSFLQPELDVGKQKDAAVSSADKIQAAVPASCATTITPACLRTLYNTVNYVPAATANNSLGIAGYLEEYANRADLQTFFSKYRTDAVGGTYTTVKLNGGLDDQTDPGVEVHVACYLLCLC